MPFVLQLAAAAAVAQPAPTFPAVTLPEGPALVEQIAAREADFFALFFTGPCDAARFRTFLADDVEMYHDRAGFNIRGADAFVKVFTDECSRRQNPGEWRSRRALVPGSMHVDPIPGWGAMQMGEHLFYEKKGANGEERLAGRARFAHVWGLGHDGQWRISRVLSYSHSAAESQVDPARSR
jgi:hypothetical protein